MILHLVQWNYIVGIHGKWRRTNGIVKVPDISSMVFDRVGDGA
jgi:hypothetical protein